MNGIKKKKCAKKRIRYLKNFEQERNRYKKHSNRKCLYNKQYYEKNIKKSAITNNDISKKIIKKYNKFRSQNTIKVCHSLEIYIKGIEKKLNIRGHIEKRLEAEKIVRWYMYIRQI